MHTILILQSVKLYLIYSQHKILEQRHAGKDSNDNKISL